MTPAAGVLQVRARGEPHPEDVSIAAHLLRLRDPATGRPLPDDLLAGEFGVFFGAGVRMFTGPLSPAAPPCMPHEQGRWPAATAWAGLSAHCCTCSLKEQGKMCDCAWRSRSAAE